jgi:HK97 family phage portal protein
MRLNSAKLVTDAALIPRDPTRGEQFSRAMTLRSKRPAIPTEQRWVSLPSNDRTFFAPPRLRHEFGLDRPYQQHSWTYAIIRALAGPISQIPLIVKYGDRSNPQTVLPGMMGYEFQELFDHPHLQLTSTELKEAHVDNLSLAGECIAIKVGADPDVPIGPYEIPKELYPFSGREFDHVMDPQRRRIIGYLHRQPGKRDADAYLAHQVCASRYFNPYYPLRGLAPHEAARQPTQSDWKQMQYNEAFFDNDATAGVVLVSQTPLTRAQTDELRESWDERNRGYRRRRRTTVLEDGIDVRDMGTTHRDMEFVNLSRFNVEQLCAVYKVPDAEINNYKNLNFATAEAIKTQFWNNSLIPIMTLLEDAWYRQILELPGRGRFWVEFDRSKIDALVENELTKLETAKVAMDMGVSFNQVNERYQLGMKKQEGWGDVGSFPMPRTPVSSLLTPIAPKDPDQFPDPGADGPEFPNPNHPGKLPHVPGTPRPPAGGGGGKPSTGGPGESPGGVSGGQGNPDQPASNGPNIIAIEPEIVDGTDIEKPGEVILDIEATVLDSEAITSSTKSMYSAVTIDVMELNVWLETRDAAKTARWERYLRFLRPWEKAFQKRYGNYLHQLRKHQLARLDALGDEKIAASAQDLGMAWRSGDVQKLIEVRKDIDDLVFDLAQWNQKLVSMMHGIYISISDEAANEALKELGIDAEAGHAPIVRTKLLEAIHDREKILVGTNDTLRADLYKEIERSLEAGETRMEMAQRIKQVFNLSNGQAMRIARTETGGMASAARFAVHQAEGLKEHEWLTARDERVRHTHRAQDAVVVPVGEKFPNGCRFPLDPEADASETINCRCCTMPVVSRDFIPASKLAILEREKRKLADADARSAMEASHRAKMIGDLEQSRASQLRAHEIEMVKARTPNITLSMPELKIPAPIVNVMPASVSLAQAPAPVVHVNNEHHHHVRVAAPEVHHHVPVHVETGDIKVEPAPVTISEGAVKVEVKGGHRKVVIERDKFGDMTGAQSTVVEPDESGEEKP